MSHEKTPNLSSTIGDSNLSKVAECFLSFGVDPAENIKKLIVFCGELLHADSAVYDRIDSVKMTRVGGWNLPEDSSKVGYARDNGGYNVVKMFSGDMFEIHHYDQPPLVVPSTDNLVRRTYFGKLVKEQSVTVGALSVLFQSKKELTESERGIIGIVASAIEIEGRRLRGEEILAQQQINIVATAKLSALGDMATGVAHEINNPLLVMVMRIEHLRDLLVNSQSSPETIKIVDSLETMTLRIAKIVKSLRTFAGDTQDESFRQVSVADLVSDTIEFCGERFKQNQITLQMDSGLDQLLLECRPTEIPRALLNLMQNSFDAIESNPDMKWVKISARSIMSRNEKCLEISITDSGSGISEEVQSRLFQPFFTTKDVGRGKGLGLSVARGIIEKHRGSLNLDTKSPNTRFVIVLPVQQS
jgi:C4-dicarboxylate-specific signal transduction histidine kinase